MGFLSKVFKGTKKLVKGIGKAVKKVGSKIWEGAKKVVKSVGKALNKLGPIGTIAVSFIAPYAIGAMASMGGTLGTVGTAIQTASTALAAPFKTLTTALGKGAAALGSSTGSALSNAGFTSLGQAVQALGTKMGSMLGYSEGTLGESTKAIWSDVATKWDASFGTDFAKNFMDDNLRAAYADPSLSNVLVDTAKRTTGDTAIQAAKAGVPSLTDTAKKVAKAYVGGTDPRVPAPSTGTAARQGTATVGLDLYSGINTNDIMQPLTGVSASGMLEEHFSNTLGLLARR